MEKFSLKYNPLFTVEIWHDFFLDFRNKNNPYELKNQLPKGYDFSKFLEVQPSPYTQQLLSRYGLLWRPSRHGFTVFSEALPIPGEIKSFHTAIPLDSTIHFEFLLLVKDPQFLNFSNIPIDRLNGDIIHFNNKIHNASGDRLYIHQTLNKFSNTAKYAIGELVFNNIGDRLYESIAASTIQENLQNRNKWAEFIYYQETDEEKEIIKQIQAVSSQDFLPKQTGSFKYSRENDLPGELIHFQLFDINNHQVDLGYIKGTTIPQGELKAPEDPNSTIEHSLDLSWLESGKYSLSITGETKPLTFYFFNFPVLQPCLGIIEVFGNCPTENNFFEEVEIDGKRITQIHAKTYTIRFKNRTTRWRYFKDGDISKTPLLEIVNPLSVNYIPVEKNLPNPKIDSIQVSIDDDSQEISEIHSNIFIYHENILQ